MSEGDFFNFVNLVLCLIVAYMTLHMIVSTPITSYNFRSGMRFFSLIACAVLFIVGAVYMSNEIQFSHRGVVTNAEIKGHETLISRSWLQNSAVEYKVTYSFSDVNNISYMGEAIVDRYTWEMAQLNPNRKIKVVYLGDDPSVSRNIENSNYIQALAMIIIGCSGLLFSMWYRRGGLYTYRQAQIKDMLAPYSGDAR